MSRFSFSVLAKLFMKQLSFMSQEELFNVIFKEILSKIDSSKWPSLDPASISRWMTGVRKLPRVLVNACINNETESIRLMSMCLDDYVIQKLNDEQQLINSVLDMIQNDTTIEIIDKDYFINYHFNDTDSVFLAHAIFLSVKINRSAQNSKTENLDSHICKDNIGYNLWVASKRDYTISHTKGNRFHTLSIINQLLPNGIITPNAFLSHGKLDNGVVEPLLDICLNSNDSLSIVGDGGIGKTTCLQKLLYNEFVTSNYSVNRPVPFFVELNRCPNHIETWYDESLKKTNFITRYIGQILENHRSLEHVSNETITAIEKEFQKSPSHGKAQYLLLLDGFNEVSTNESVRTYLSNEISVLNNYPNIRIITTSRVTHSAYYASKFTNIKLIGLKDNDIITYMQGKNVPDVIIGNAKSSKSLWDCLKVPLYLCMFTASELEYGFLPETAGEILNCFFHRNSSFYNTKNHNIEISTDLTKSQIVFIMNFILPYIGWTFDEKKTFYLNADELIISINSAMDLVEKILFSSAVVPFSDFDYRSNNIKCVYESFYNSDGTLNCKCIISCISDYLGIIYKYIINEGKCADRIRYSFCHHNFRDYFSAMWDVQLLNMLKYLVDETALENPIEIFETNKYALFLNTHYWHPQKVTFISQILMEHRNKPFLNPLTQNWKFPRQRYEEQSVLENVLNYCRHLCEYSYPIRHLLTNILSAILEGRKEFSGLDLSNLNLEGIRFFNISCSKYGRSEILSANFCHSILNEDNFFPENHDNNIIEYVYHDNQCFTIDQKGLIKCWDILSGKMEYELFSDDPLGKYDFSSKGFLKISKDGHWLITKVQKKSSNEEIPYLNLFDLTMPNKPPRQLLPHMSHRLITFLGFTEDSQSIIMLCDYNSVYCFDGYTALLDYYRVFPLLKQSELYANDSKSPIFAYTSEYDVYITEEQLSTNWDLDEEPNDDTPILCQIIKLFPDSGESHEIYEFFAEPDTSPTISFFHELGCFILYNYKFKRIEKFDCINQKCVTILSEITSYIQETPHAIHKHPKKDNECFVMFSNICFHAYITSDNKSGIIMQYPISGVEELLHDSNSDDLEFATNVCPTNNKFIVCNDSNTYEWDSDNDTLMLKYNCAYYDCAALISFRQEKSLVLVHKSNGVSVFGKDPLKLQQHFCFHEPDYYIESCCYDDINYRLALSFARPDHKKVILMDIETGNQKQIFSTIENNESIQTLCFSNNGEFLLITTESRCIEYCIANNQYETVVKSSDNERLGMGNYVNDEIEVLVVEDNINVEIAVTSRCEYYRKICTANNTQFKLQWYYLIPELEKENFCYFIYSNNDFGVQCSYNLDGIQSYWITRGFFLENLNQFESVLNPICYAWNGNQFVRTKKKFEKLNFILVKHTEPLANPYRINIKANGLHTYMYRSDDMRCAVIAEAGKKLSYCADLNALTYQRLWDDFHKNIGNADGSAYWEFATAWEESILVGCCESHKLYLIKTDPETNIEELKYYPGISICGCDFTNAIIDKSVSEILKHNN